METLGKTVASKFGEFICQLPSTEAYESLYPIGVQKIYLTLQQIKAAESWVRPKVYCQLAPFHPVFALERSVLVLSIVFVMHFE